MTAVTNTLKVNKYARKGSVAVKNFIAHFCTVKCFSFWKITTVKSRIVFGVYTGGKEANLRQSFKRCLSSRLYSSIQLQVQRSYIARVPQMFSVVKTRSLNCPKILFHRLIGEALLFLWNTIFLMKAMYQEEIFAVEKWQNWLSR